MHGPSLVARPLIALLLLSLVGCGGGTDDPLAAEAPPRPSPTPAVETSTVPDIVGLTYQADGKPFWPNDDGFHASTIEYNTEGCPDYDPAGAYPVNFTVDRTEPAAGVVVKSERGVAVYVTPDCAAYEEAKLEAARVAEEERVAAEEARVAAEAEAARKAEEERIAAASVSQQNARRLALDYLDYSAFSRTGLIKQLKYEGFSAEDATWGVDNITVDWMEQAAKQAQDYLDFSAFSRSGLINQLVYEGFSREEAEHGASAVGL